MGLDASTQGLKATAVDEALGVVHRFAINYQADLTGYGTTNGVVAKPGSVVVQPTLMVRAQQPRLLRLLRHAGTCVDTDTQTCA